MDGAWAEFGLSEADVGDLDCFIRKGCCRLCGGDPDVWDDVYGEMWHEALRLRLEDVRMSVVLLKVAAWSRAMKFAERVAFDGPLSGARRAADLTRMVACEL